MSTALKTNTSELDDKRVRIEVEVPPEAVEQELNTAAAELGREMRIPGFRKGKVPAQMVIRQLGREAVIDEAVRHALPGWYEQAVTDAGIAAVGDPKLDLGDLPEKGCRSRSRSRCAVVPKAKLGDYKGLEVGRREATAGPDAVIRRGARAPARARRRSRPSSARPRSGDFVVIDFVGSVDGEPFEGGEARGYLSSSARAA